MTIKEIAVGDTVVVYSGALISNGSALVASANGLRPLLPVTQSATIPRTEL